MAVPLRVGGTPTVKIGPFVSVTDGVTPVTGLTPSIVVHKGGAASAARHATGAIVDDGNGYYLVPLDATDTDTVGPLLLTATDSTTYAPEVDPFFVYTAAVYDALYASTAALNVGAAASVTAPVTVGTNNDKTGYALSGAGVTAAQAGLASATALAVVQADTDDLQTRVTDLQSRTPAALVAGRMPADAVAISGSTAAADAVEANIANLDAAVSTRSTYAGGAVAAVTGNVGGDILGDVVGSTGSVTAPVTAGTVSDKTGYRLSATGVDDIWDEPIPEPTGVFSWATATPRKIVGWLGARSKNKKAQTSTQTILRNEADTATIGASAVDDVGGTAHTGTWT